MDDSGLQPDARSVATRFALSLMAFVIVSSSSCGDEDSGEPVSAPIELTLEARASFDAEFSSVTGVRELLNGNVLVPDRREGAIKLLGLGTDSVALIGREGDGPGEFRTLGEIFPLKGDSTAVYDRGGPRFLIYDGRQEFARFERLGLEAFTPGPGYPIGSDTTGSGSWILSAHTSTRVVEAGADYRSIVTRLIIRADRATDVGDTIGEFSGGETVARTIDGVYHSTRGVPSDAAFAFPDGWLAVVHQDPYRVDWVTASGDRILGSPIEVEVMVHEGVVHSILALHLFPSVCRNDTGVEEVGGRCGAEVGMMESLEELS